MRARAACERRHLLKLRLQAHESRRRRRLPRTCNVHSHQRRLRRPHYPQKERHDSSQGYTSESAKACRISYPISHSMHSANDLIYRYARSKLANIQYARALQRKFSTQGFNNIYVNYLNPGTIGSSTFGSDNSPGIPWWIKIASKALVSITSVSPQAGALTS